jgi:hypothetical protein
VVQRFSPYHFDAERLGIKNLKPASMYRHIYPESRVDLNEIAYFFDYTLDESAEDPNQYIKPVKRAANNWKKAHDKKPVFFRYRKGPGFIELQDNRPLDKEEVGPTRKTVLAGVESEVYLLCDSIKSIREINDYVKAKTNPPWGDEQVKAMLERFVEQRLMYVEKERYLSLATAVRQKKAVGVGKREEARERASGARTLKVLDMVAGAGQCCGEQAESLESRV